MLCSACSAENRPGARFCNDCGAALSVICASCGQGNPPSSRFCDACGQPLTALIRGVDPAPASPRNYTPRHLAEKILAGRDALQGERKQVTVLFADLVGSTEVIRDLDAEDAQRLLDGAVSLMRDAVHRYEGTVSRMTGDGIMALFGAPIAHEDHAIRACFAALAVQDSLRRYADDLQHRRGATLQGRVGLHSGEVVVRLISDDLHMDYTAMGQTVHLASRLEHIAPPDGIALTAQTLSLAQGYVRVHSLGPVGVKGLVRPIEVFALDGVGDAPTRLQASASRGLTPLAGRDVELGVLTAALDRAGGGHGEVVAIVGEPGVGKSRLAWELTRSGNVQGVAAPGSASPASGHVQPRPVWKVLETTAVSFGTTTSYGPVIDLLKTYCGIEPRDDPETVRRKVTATLLGLDPSLRPGLPALLTLLDVPTDDPEWETLDPPRRRQRTVEAVKRLLLRESQVQPLLLVIENLHWLDSVSQALLDSLVESLPSVPVLLVVNYRPEYRHAWSNKTWYTQIALGPLVRDSSEALASSLLGDDPSLAPLKPLLLSRTGGNPFFLEESIQGLIETAALVGERGAYRLTSSVQQIDVPATVQAILAARIDRLPAEAKRLLQAASVLGEDVALGLVRAVADLPDTALQEGLTRLQTAELLYEATLFPEPAYAFKHALTRDVAYASLLQDRRRGLHAAVVEALERLHAENLAEHVDQLAHHAVCAEVWDKALPYLRQAGARALSRWAYHEAVTCFEQALTALDHLPTTPELQATAIDVRLELRSALGPSGDVERVFAVVEPAEMLATALDDRPRLAWIYGYLASALYQVGQTRRSVEYGERAVTLSEEVGDPAIRAASRYQLGQALFFLGDMRRAREHLMVSVSLLADDAASGTPGLTTSLAIVAYQWLALSLAELGEFEQAHATARRGVDIAEALGQPYGLVASAWGALVPLCRQGQFEVAIPQLERALDLAQLHEIAPAVPTHAAELGHALAVTGRVAEGVPLLDLAARSASIARKAKDQTVVLIQQSEVQLIAAQPDEALTLAECALKRTRTYQLRGYEAYALLALGGAETKRSLASVARAEEHLRQALVIAEELGMRPLQARCHLGLGTLYRRIGRPDEARPALSTAVAMLREMEMTFWLPDAEAELARVDGLVAEGHGG